MIILIISIILGIKKYLEWPVRFSGKLDKFFGENNWKIINLETKESIIYEKYYSSRNAPNLDSKVPGKFKNWYIQSKNKQGKNIVFVITNHSHKISNDKYWIFSGKRLSSKQAFGMELMEISFKIIVMILKINLLEMY